MALWLSDLLGAAPLRQVRKDADVYAAEDCSRESVPSQVFELQIGDEVFEALWQPFNRKSLEGKVFSSDQKAAATEEPCFPAGR